MNSRFSNSTVNVRLTIEYDGEPFCGWQRQAGLPTVQAEVEAALQQIVGRKVALYGAGRTDSGVHAQGQVANFLLEPPYPPIPVERWRLALNTKLPFSIRVLESSAVPLKFHAQRSAVSKTYEYRILNRSFSSALDRRNYFCPQPLRWDAMQRACPLFLGEKDFRAFQSAGTELKSTVRRLTRFEIVEDSQAAGLYRIIIEGNGFLKQMVRNMIGTLLDVGEGREEPEHILRVLASGRRDFAGRAVPARGLTLVDVKYEA